MLTRSRSRSHSSTPAADDSQSSSLSLSQLDSAPQEETAPRTGRKVKGPRRGRGFTRKPDRWMCILPKAFQPSDEAERSVSIVSLRNPNSSCSCKYLLKEESGCQSSELCEIFKFSDDPRSWFIGNTINTDGSLFMCNPLDPLFLALPYFQAAAKTGKFTTLDVILEDSDHVDCFGVLSKCVPLQQWSNISEDKEVLPNNMVYRYSKEKTLLWLCKKVEVLANALEEERVYVGRGSQTSNLVQSSKGSEVTKDDFLSYSCGIVKDYLNKDLSQEISRLYPASANGTSERLKSKHDGGDRNGVEPPAKRRHLEAEPLEDYSKTGINVAEPTTVTPKLTSAQKNLAKIDKTGIKPLSSFFQKKPSKKK